MNDPIQSEIMLAADHRKMGKIWGTKNQLKISILMDDPYVMFDYYTKVMEQAPLSERVMLEGFLMNRMGGMVEGTRTVTTQDYLKHLIDEVNVFTNNYKIFKYDRDQLAGFDELVKQGQVNSVVTPLTEKFEDLPPLYYTEWDLTLLHVALSGSPRLKALSPDVEILSKRFMQYRASHLSIDNISLLIMIDSLLESNGIKKDYDRLSKAVYRWNKNITTTEADEFFNTFVEILSNGNNSNVDPVEKVMSFI